MTKKIVKNKEKFSNRWSLIVFFASLALVIGLFIGNSVLPATKYIENKNISNTQSSEMQVDMTPRIVNIDNSSNSFEDVAPKVSCCVVGINAISTKYSSVGSGVAVAKNGYIVTNHHVIDGANQIYILLADGSNSTASLVWQDSALDLAILKSEVDLPYLEIASIDEIEVGEPVMAIGTPLSLQFQHSHTAGIISALNRTIQLQDDSGLTYMQSLIQHDASINPGNSGGPSITLDGKVVGINTLKITEAEGIGFAIPAWIIQPILEHIVSDGYYETVYLGIYGYDSTIAKYYGEQVNDTGVIIINKDGSGPLKDANLMSGDIITKIGDTDINTMLDLRLSLYHYKVGDTVSLTILRNTETHTVSATLSKHPNSP